MPRPPVKKTLKLAKAEAKGRTIGELEGKHLFYKGKKGWTLSLNEHISDFIKSMIDKIDPLELAAMMGTTFIVHEAINAATDILQMIENAFPSNLLVGSFPYNIIPNLIIKLGGEPLQPAEIPKNELLNWTISFITAFVLIRFGPQIISSLGGLKGIATLIIGGSA